MENSKLNSPEHIIYNLTYQSYCAQRSYGMSHEATVRIGLGNDEFLAWYTATPSDSERAFISLETNN